MKSIWKILLASFYLITGGIILIFSKKNLKPIYRGLKIFIEHPSYQITLQKLKADPEFAQLIAEKYRDRLHPHWDELKALPPGTLGYEFAKIMNNPDVTPLEKLPEANVEISEEIDYIRRRIRFVHDIHHVICGYPVTEVGEMGISAFYVAQINSPLNAGLLAISLIKCTMKEPARLHELMGTIAEGWQQGLTAKNIFGGRWEEKWALPVSVVREQYSIKASHLDFIEAHARSVLTG